MITLNNDYIKPIISGNYEIRIANCEQEILQAQKLRYEFLIKEYSADDGSNNNGANPTDSNAALNGIDCDDFDKYCAHLVVINHDLPDDKKIIATYRMMRKQYKDIVGKWYSSSEFNLDNLKNIEEQVVELGRATVHANHRNNVTLKFLWYGICAFLRTYNLRYMIGTASFKTLDVNTIATELSFLSQFCAMPDEYMAYAITEDARDINLIAKEDIDAKKTIMALPPIIKGYLKAGGCTFSKTAFIDRPFGCTDVLVFFDLELMSEKYRNHFMGDESEN